MTRDEAKIVFLNRGYVEVEGGTIYDPNKWREACVVISEWLEQQPQDSDLISRQAVYEALNTINGTAELDKAYEVIEQLPSVSQPQTGHWISREGKGQVLPFWGRYECSECGECAENSSFCPNCGARMVGDNDGR